MVNRAFPEVEFPNWDLCEALLPHARVCASWVERWALDFLEAARLLNQTAYYLYRRALFGEALRFWQGSLAIREKVAGPDHAIVGQSLNNLAALYEDQGKYSEAEPLYRRALAIGERAFGLDHPDVAQTLNNLALLYRTKGNIARPNRSTNAHSQFWRMLSIPITRTSPRASII